MYIISFLKYVVFLTSCSPFLEVSSFQLPFWAYLHLLSSNAVSFPRCVPPVTSLGSDGHACVLPVPSSLLSAGHGSVVRALTRALVTVVGHRVEQDIAFSWRKTDRKRVRVPDSTYHCAIPRHSREAWEGQRAARELRKLPDFMPSKVRRRQLEAVEEMVFLPGLALIAS